MLFHTIKQIADPAEDGSSVTTEFGNLQLEAKAKRKQRNVAEIRPWMVFWATGLVMFFIVMSLIAHHINYEALATVSLNLAVAVTSASVGAVFGERIAVKELLP